MQSSTILSLNVQTPNYATVMHAVQFDKLSRKITAYLFDGALPFIPPEGALAMVRYSKPDGTMGFYDTLEDETTTAVTWEGNTATVWLAEQVLTVAGNVLCQIQFFTASERLSTFTFVIGVEANAVSDESIESTDYFSILTQRIEAILGAVIYPPTINSQNHWVLFDPETQEYYDSGVDATGEQGPTGPTGPYMASIARVSGTGAAGTTDQYQVTLSDGTHPTGTISVYNGANGEGSPGSATPLMDGTAFAGSANSYAREDHVHPKDTSKANSSDVGDVSSLSGFTATNLVGAANELKTAQTTIGTGTVTQSYAVSAGHIRLYRIGKVCLVKFYVNYNANITVDSTIATLSLKPNDITFATLNDSTDGTFFEIQLNFDGTLQTRSAITLGHWLFGELVYFTSD